MARNMETKSGSSELKRQLEEIDSDGSGTVDAMELNTVLKRCKVRLSESELHRVVGMFDRDGNGRIDYSEMMSFLKEQAGVVDEVDRTCGWV